MQQEENNAFASQSFDETYNIIECASGSVQNRHDFKRKDEKFDYAGQNDQYHSTFLHSSEIES